MELFTAEKNDVLDTTSTSGCRQVPFCEDNDSAQCIGYSTRHGANCMAASAGWQAVQSAATEAMP
jgi:hypothetical protein